jgi:thermitase
MSALFLMGFLVYLAALSFSSGTLSYKLMILVRDMIVMAVVTQAFNLSRKRLLLSAGLGLVAALVIYLSYFQTLMLTFPQLPVETLDVEGEFLVKIDPDKPEVLDKMQAAFPCTAERAFIPERELQTELDDYYVIDLKSSSRRAYKHFYTTYAGNDAIEWIEPNEVVSQVLPEPTVVPEFKGKHFVNDPRISMQWGFGPMQVDELHRVIVESGLQPRRKARIAIIDSGVDGKHPDLKANYLGINPDYDKDKIGHGTHCAGIAGAVSNNGIGIASLSPGTGFVQIMGIKVVNQFGLTTQKALIGAIIEAVDNDVDVISLSMGGMTTQEKQKAYTEVIQYAADRGVIFVAAAGNHGKSASQISPANVDGVIVVTAVDPDNKRAHFSGTVEEIEMGVAAPGTNIFSTLPGNRYGALTGTSMATPYVAGLVGLLKSFNPSLTSKEVFDILHSTGRATADGAKTGPLIQPLKALERVVD